MKPALLRALVLCLAAAPFAPLDAQVPVTITTYAGDTSAGSLGAAVSTSNSTGNQDLVFQISPGGGSVTLGQPLPAFTQAASFTGVDTGSFHGVNLYGNDSSQSTLFFQGSFYEGNKVALNLFDLGSGQDAGLTATNVFMDANSGLGIDAGDGGFLSTSGGSGDTGQAGGKAFWQSAAVTMNGIQGGSLQAGAGGAVTDLGGTNDVGGAGGQASFQTGAWVLSDSNYSIVGGAGGAVSDASGSVGGAGGAVSVSTGNWSVDGSSGVFMNGGNGQAGDSGGMGGSVTVASGVATVTGSNWILTAGKGGSGDTAGGAGGSVLTNWGSMTVSQGAGLNLTAGNGGSASLTGGAGGNLASTGVSILESGSASNFNLKGGNGGNSSAGTGGNGGSAALTMINVQLTSATGMSLSGGNGGSGVDGGNGGNAFVSIGSIAVTQGSFLDLSGGNGGSGTNGGNGGDALMLADSVTLGGGGNLTLKGGDAGDPGGSAGGVGLGIQNAYVGTGSTLNLVTGLSGTGPAGSVVASLGDLRGSGDVVVSGTGSVLQVGSGSFSGVLSGTESLVQNASGGALTLSGANSYTGGTTVSGGTLALDTGGSLGPGGVFVQSAKTLEYLDSASAGYEAVTAAGIVNFDDQSDAGAATFTLQGSGLAGFSGTAQGGTARFILSGGSLDLSGSAAGLVTIGSLEGTGAVTLGAFAGLAVGSNGLSTDYEGTISDGTVGSGALEKIGGGALTLTSGNTYSGGTVLRDGDLVLGAPQSMVSGGVTTFTHDYLGSGSVSILGGTLASNGNSAFLSIGGDYVQSQGGALQIGFYGADAQGNDAVSINGAAQLGGTLDLVAGTGYSAMTVIGNGGVVLLSADGGITGRFRDVQESLPGMRLLPIYTPTLLEVEAIVLSFQAAAATPNQKAVAADLDAVYLSPDLMNLMLILGPQTDGAALRAAYDQLSPASYSVLYQAGFQEADLRAAGVEDRLAQIRDGSGAPVTQRRAQWQPTRFAGNLSVADEMAMIVRPRAAGEEGAWGGFFTGGGGVFTVGDTPNAKGFQSTSYGLPAAGVDYQFDRQFALGLMVSYGESDIALNAGGSVTQTGGALGVYGTWHPGRAYLDALAWGGLESYSSQRQAFGGDVGGKTRGLSYGARVGGGYDWGGRGWSLGPLAAVQWTRVGLDGFTEQGPVDSVDIASQSADSIITLAGFQARASLRVGGLVLTPQARASWEHEFAYQGGTVAAGFGQGDSFTVDGPSVGQDGFLVRGGLDTAFSKQLTMSLGYQGELGRTNIQSTQFDAGLKFGF